MRHYLIEDDTGPRDNLCEALRGRGFAEPLAEVERQHAAQGGSAA